MRASCIARVTAAQATRSPRNFGTMTPRLAAPMVWPARPMRCIPLATDGGASIWIDEIDRAHVDAELERRGGDQAAELARP